MISPLTEALATLIRRPDVAGALVVSDEGLVVSGSMPVGMESEAIAALAATARRSLASLSLAMRHAAARHTVIDGPDGSVILAQLGAGTTLLVLASANGDLGELLFAIRGILPQLAGLV